MRTSLAVPSRRLLAALVLCSLAGPAGAITDEELFRTFRFNFANPGGRALGLAGAFMAVADDATAASANPAGLMNLEGPQLFTELRSIDSDPVSLADAADGTLRGTSFNVDVTSTATFDETVRPSFISYVYPMKSWGIGVSRQEIVNSQSNVHMTTTAKGATDVDVIGSTASQDLRVSDLNLSFAFRAGDWFSGGVTLTYSRLEWDAATANTFLNCLNVDPDGDGVTEFDCSLLPDYGTVIDDSDNDLSWTVGLLFKPVDKLHVGVVYRKGAEFDVRESITDPDIVGIPDDQEFPSAQTIADFLGNQNGAFDDPLVFTTSLNVPDRYGIGLGIKPTPNFTIALDATRIEYSDLIDEDFKARINPLTFPDTFDSAAFEIEDEEVYRLGLEYVFTNIPNTTLAVRAGAWLEPDVRLQSRFGAKEIFIANDSFFPGGGSDELHYTAGIGFVFQEKLQLDFAADISDFGETVIASFIYHF